MALNNKDASIILGMLARGDHNQDIAAWFGENPARVVEVKDGMFGSISAAPASELPPKGAVGPKARRMRGRVKIAIEKLQGVAGGAEVLSILEGALADFNKHEM